MLDPFCGCGTAVAAAQKLDRQWLGIDITHLAVALMKSRLKTMFDLDAGAGYRVVGEPQDVGGARGPVRAGPFPVPVLGRLPAGGPAPGPTKTGRRPGALTACSTSLTASAAHRRRWWCRSRAAGPGSGHPRPEGVVEREKAALGLFITLQEPTRPMRGRGGLRRLLPFGPVAAGLPENPDPHHRPTAGRPGVRPAPAPARLPTRRPRPPIRGRTGRAGGTGGVGATPSFPRRREPRWWSKARLTSNPVVPAQAGTPMVEQSKTDHQPRRSREGGNLDGGAKQDKPPTPSFPRRREPRWN